MSSLSFHSQHDGGHKKSSDHNKHGCCCEKPCKGKICPVPDCEVLPSETIACLYSDAVVAITSEFTLVDQALLTLPPGLGVDSRADVEVNGTGWIYSPKCGKGKHRQLYIICEAATVLMPPSLTSTVRRWPFTGTVDPEDTILNEMTRATRIFVSVKNVNNKGKAYVYEAELLGVDGAGDIAILQLSPNRAWNKCLDMPEAKCHSFFDLADCDEKVVAGQTVYTIGDYFSNGKYARSLNSFAAVNKGVVADPRYLDYSGWMLAQSILISNIAVASSGGMPIVNGVGKVVGMQTTSIEGATASLFVGVNSGLFDNPGVGFFAGPTANFMRRVIARVINAIARPNCPDQQKWVEVVEDTDVYYRYIKAYLGIAYDVYTGEMANQVVDYTSGLAPLGQPRFRYGLTGEFLPGPDGVDNGKQIEGVRVLGLAGLNPTGAIAIPNGYWYVPGGVSGNILPSGLDTSSFLTKLLPGDVVTQINNVRLGDLERQWAPSNLTWNMLPGYRPTLVYMRGGNLLNATPTDDTQAQYDIETTTNGLCLDFPLCMDYPWYNLVKWPNVIADPTVYPGFTPPATQYALQMYMQLLAPGSGLFHPAF